MQPLAPLSRRDLIGAGLFLAATPALASRALAAPAPGRMSFEIWRNGQQIGHHQVTLKMSGDETTAAIEAALVVKIGPIPVFHYHHQATETWRGGRFVSLDAKTVSNGKVEAVRAIRTADAVEIVTAKGSKISGPASAAPFTHWNPAVLRGPLFHPQTGLLLREQVAVHGPEMVKMASGASIPATRYSLTGDAQITDWYDAQQSWAGLWGKVNDGSIVEYRRI